LFGDAIPNGLMLVVLAHAYINIAVVVRLVGAQWATLDLRMEVTAATLRANPFRVFTTITLPSLRNSIVLAASVVFIFSFSSLGIVVVLGDGSKSGKLTPGHVADAVLWNTQETLPYGEPLLERPADEILSTLIFRGNRAKVEKMWVHGKRNFDLLDPTIAESHLGDDASQTQSFQSF
jgi:hypothetical protein